jgi:hypothetical protein
MKRMNCWTRAPGNSMVGIGNRLMADWKIDLAGSDTAAGLPMPPSQFAVSSPDDVAARPASGHVILPLTLAVSLVGLSPGG